MNTGDIRRAREKRENLRDEFAKVALNGILSNTKLPTGAALMDRGAYKFGDPSIAAKWAYELADAMLKERDKNE